MPNRAIDTNIIDDWFGQLNENTRYYCVKIADNPYAYQVSSEMKILNDIHDIEVHISFHMKQQTVSFLMFVSQGFVGKNTDIINSLLLRINSETMSGSFAIWHETGDIIYKLNLPMAYMNYDEMLSLIKYFEKIYLTAAPLIHTYAYRLNLRHMEGNENEDFAKQIEWYIKGLEQILIE